MLEAETSSHRKKFLDIRRNFLSQKESSCHRKEFHATVRNFFSQEETSFHGFVSEWMSGWEDQNHFDDVQDVVQLFAAMDK